MNISLTSELEQYINNQVQTGLYHSSSEVIRAALRLLIQTESNINYNYENYKMHLKQEVQIGLNQAKNNQLISGGKAISNFIDFRKKQIKKNVE